MKALGGLDLIKKTVVNCEFVPQYVKIKTKIIFEIKTEKFMGILIYYYHPHVRWLKYQRLSRVFFLYLGSTTSFYSNISTINFPLENIRHNLFKFAPQGSRGEGLSNIERGLGG